MLKFHTFYIIYKQYYTYDYFIYSSMGSVNYSIHDSSYKITPFKNYSCLYLLTRNYKKYCHMIYIFIYIWHGFYLNIS